MSSVAGGTRSWLADLRQRVWRVAPADAGPVVLRHSRIYILPTRRGLALMTTLAIMLVTSMNYALSLGFAVTFVVAGLVASALLQTFRNIAGIAAAPLAAGEGFVGDRIEFTLSLANPESTRRGIMVSARDSVPVTIDVPAGATRQAVLIVPAHRRGHVALGRVTVSTDFPLGLWQAWAYVHFPLSGIAYPAPERGAPPLPPGRLGGDARRAGRAADAEFSGLREYQLGDPMNRVAWKAVARGAGW